MYLIQKLKSLEKQIVFMRWGANAGYVKLKYIGADFVELEIIDLEDMEYKKTVIINPNLILEVILGSPDVSRIIAAVSSTLPCPEERNS